VTEEKLNANKSNAQFSTGPRTSEGKARVAANSVTLGLFASRDLIRPEERAEYDELRAALEAELRPASAMERTHAMEILHASWRLRRCALVEAGLTESTVQSGLDPMEDAASTAQTQAAVDRARADARNNLRRASEDLSRLQTERLLRAELDPGSDPEPEGLVSRQNISKALAHDARGRLALSKLKGDEGIESILLRAVRQMAGEKKSGSITKQTQTEVGQFSDLPTPRP
jgi:hypothetical protein